MNDIQDLLVQAIHNLWHVSVPVEVTPAPENTTFTDGRSIDYACNVAMRLTGTLKNPTLTPRLIAEKLRTEFLTLAQKTPLSGTEIEIAGPGFLNFISPDEYFSAKIADFSTIFSQNTSPNESSSNISPDEYSTSQALTDLDIFPKLYQNQTIICEFSDPNPFKVLHVGHLYTSIVGDAISRLIETSGGKVIRANFGGDVGLHAAKNIYAILRHREEATILDPANSTPLDQKAEFMAACYVEGTNAYEDDPTAHDEITTLNHLLYQLVQFAIDHHYINGTDLLTDEQISHLSTEFIPTYQSSDSQTTSTPSRTDRTIPTFTPDEITTISQLYWWGRNTSYAYFKEFYAKIGLNFDKIYPESTVANLGLETVKAHTVDSSAPNPLPAITTDTKVYTKSNGAIIFPGEDYGLHTRVFINQNGLPTYETKDVGLIFTKWQDYHFDKSIVITGNEQSDYMKVVLKSIEQYAPDLVHHTTHLTHGLVKLPGHIKMSSRKGNFLKAVDVLNLVTTTLEETHHSADPIISLGATKYALLKYKLGGDIDFNLKESVSMTGNSGPYLQYSAVRAKKILAKASKTTSRTTAPKTSSKTTTSKTSTTPSTATSQSAPPTSLTSPEKSLIKKLLAYPTTITEATRDLAPHKLCAYLYDAAQEFSRFYEHTPVIGSPEEAFRLQLVRTYLSVLTHGLNILGINTPEKM